MLLSIARRRPLFMPMFFDRTAYMLMRHDAVIDAAHMSGADMSAAMPSLLSLHRLSP